MDARELLAWNMRRLRVERGLSQEKLALDSAIDRTYVSRLERRIENPSIAIVEKLALTLDVPIAQMFAEPGHDDPAPQPLRAGRKPKS
ncbi:helix-turn-helix transcriptional regulator [Bosea sp. TND4EK4]|uniref:helix-turn-helix domain-containing protein n=1 Tax=Bosea sp. TND4EK4 TaxID=1907408 RepID=UPI00095688A8|nr:helix-turn-helix transcriptional regulator [Bosea sp. TND4EK4]SIQ36362.1 DNA-binding transcriptional regulator, XRE-family HTH domain [Bosea sp. TND4EK4]